MLDRIRVDDDVMEAQRRVTIVKTGTFLNQEQVVCDVRVVRVELRPSEHEPDRPASTVFCIEWGSPVVKGKFSSGLFGFTSTDEAAQHVERSAAAVRWNE